MCACDTSRWPRSLSTLRHSLSVRLFLLLQLLLITRSSRNVLALRVVVRRSQSNFDLDFRAHIRMLTLTPSSHSSSPSYFSPTLPPLPRLSHSHTHTHIHTHTHHSTTQPFDDLLVIASSPTIRYVACPGAPTDEEVLAPGNSAALTVLLDSFASMGFDAADLDSMQRVLAALLHLGNVRVDSPSWQMTRCSCIE